MKYADAVKQVRTEKPKENFMLLSFDLSYNSKLLLPHKDGAAILAMLINAEVLNDRYTGEKGIVEIHRGAVTSSQLSRQEYERFKIAALLNISPDEVKDMMAAENKPVPTPT